MYVIGKEMFVKCSTNIPLSPSLFPDIKNDNFFPKGVSEVACLSA